MVYTIKIEGMEFRASHGCYDVEQRVGGNFTVDIALEVGGSGSGCAELPVEVPDVIQEAVEADDIEGTVNYVEVYEVVRAQMAIPSRIVENVAHRIAVAVRERFRQVRRVEVTVSKLAPPIGGKARRVSATLSK
jgi:dihydroneopterin aldolase